MIDHVDFVLTHECNLKCPYCVDAFCNKNREILSVENAMDFLKRLKNRFGESLSRKEVLFLGGEPTILGAKKLKEFCSIVRDFGMRPIISTNGLNFQTILEIYDLFDSIQVTENRKNSFHNCAEKINIKTGVNWMSLDELKDWIEKHAHYQRRSLVEYFDKNGTPIPYRFQETKDWLYGFDNVQKGSYLLADIMTPKALFAKDIMTPMVLFVKDIKISIESYEKFRIPPAIGANVNVRPPFFTRFKRIAPQCNSQTNKEPDIPKLFPNGNYSDCWENENMNDYLNLY